MRVVLIADGNGGERWWRDTAKHDVKDWPCSDDVESSLWEVRRVQGEGDVDLRAPTSPGRRRRESGSVDDVGRETLHRIRSVLT